MKTKTGDILAEVKSGIILQQVNAQGVMGSGIAYQIKLMWPKVFEEYSAVFKQRRSESLMGRVILTKVAEDLSVASIIGQERYGRDKFRYTSYDALDEGTKRLACVVMGRPIHHPLIGCGLGGGDWNIVSAIITANLGNDTTLWVLPNS